MSHRLSVSLFALYLLLIGIGQFLLLPPFEGYDETGHYSLIAQVAEQGTFPLDGNATIAAQVKNYQQNGPMPYAVFEPYQENGGLTYPAFFHNAPLREAYPQTFGQPDGKPFYEPTENRNWQIQHPPLYYLLMGSILAHLPDTSFLDRFFVLRLASYLLACTGLVIGMAGTLRYTNKNLHPYLTLAFFLYPALLPEIVPEFARLGNDSLCALIFGCAWALSLKHIAGQGSTRSTLALDKPVNEEMPEPLSSTVIARSAATRRSSPQVSSRRTGLLRRPRPPRNDVVVRFIDDLALGLLWGAGLLTKAFFLPVIAGWCLFHLTAAFLHRKKTGFSKPMLNPLLFAAPPVALGASWYLFKYLQTGIFLGHLEYKVALDQSQGFWHELAQHASFLAFSNNFFDFLLTWSWVGIASQVRLHELILLPMILLPIWLLIRSLTKAEKPSLYSPQSLALFLLTPLLLGLAHHAMVLQAIDPKGGTPAWYLHIFMPSVALLFAHGLRALWPERLHRAALSLLTLYAIGVTLFARWADLALTGGCAIFDANKLYNFLMPAACLSVAPEVLQRVSLWGTPATGVALILAATFLLLALIALAWRQIPHIRKDFT